MVIHGTWLTAFQVQPAPAVIAKPLPLPPVAGTATEVGLMEYVQPESWFTVTERPATVTIPVRAGPAFGATDRSVGPDAEPLGGESVIHGMVLEVLHGQSAVPVTSMRVVLPAAGAVTVSGATVNAHPPSWPSVNV